MVQGWPRPDSRSPAFWQGLLLLFPAWRVSTVMHALPLAALCCVRARLLCSVVPCTPCRPMHTCTLAPAPHVFLLQPSCLHPWPRPSIFHGLMRAPLRLACSRPVTHSALFRVGLHSGITPLRIDPHIRHSFIVSTNQANAAHVAAAAGLSAGQGAQEWPRSRAEERLHWEEVCSRKAETKGKNGRAVLVLRVCTRTRQVGGGRGGAANGGRKNHRAPGVEAQAWCSSKCAAPGLVERRN